MKNGVSYLGDGLYASFDGYQISLMANSHIQPTDTVYLNGAVCRNFVAYIEQIVGHNFNEQPRSMTEPEKLMLAALLDISKDPYSEGDEHGANIDIAQQTIKAVNELFQKSNVKEGGDANAEASAE